MDIRKFLNSKPKKQSNLDENVKGPSEMSNATDERHSLHVRAEGSTNGPSGERSVCRVADQHVDYNTESDSKTPAVDLATVIDRGPIAKVTANSLDLGENQPARPRIDFPMSTTGKGKNERRRSFSAAWYDERTWLEYSIKNDAAFCYACRKFGSSSGNSDHAFTVTGFRNWKSALSSNKGLIKHACSKEHISNMCAWEELKQRTSIGTEISTMVNKDQLDRNVYYVSSLIDIVLFAVSNELPLRGSHEAAPDSASDATIDDEIDSGLFLKLFKYTLEKDKKLAEVYATIPRNASYTSHEIQNELIEIMASVVNDETVKEVGDAWYTIKSDGTRDATGVENISIVVRYVTAHNEIKERLLCISSTKEFHAEALRNVILDNVTRLGLDTGKILSQCYDGASVMSGINGGVQKKIQDKLQCTVPYVHCYNHKLHLVVVHVISTEPQLQEFFDLCDALYKFVRKPNIQARYDGVTLKRLLDQRWSGHLDTVQAIITSYDDIIGLLNEVQTTRIGTTDVRVEAAGLLLHVRSFQFRFMSRMVFRILTIFKPADKILQSRDIDLLSAVRLVRSVLETVGEMRSDRAYEECCEQATAANGGDDVEESRPAKRQRVTSTRLAGSIVYESTGQRQSIDQHAAEIVRVEMKRLYMATIDSVVEEVKYRFSDSNVTFIEALEATDPKSTEFLSAEKLKPLADLTGVALESAELEVAKRFVISNMGMSSTIDVLKSPVMCALPSVRNVLQIALTFGASTARCESSFSTLTRILTPYRRSMLQGRKANLVLLAFEKQLTQQLQTKEMKEKVLRKFHNSTRRLQLY